MLQYLLVSDGSVQDIAQQMALSRPVLYRHIRSLNEKTEPRAGSACCSSIMSGCRRTRALPLKKARISRRETNVPPLSFEKNDVK